MTTAVVAVTLVLICLVAGLIVAGLLWAAAITGRREDPDQASVLDWIDRNDSDEPEPPVSPETSSARKDRLHG